MDQASNTGKRSEKTAPKELYEGFWINAQEMAVRSPSTFQAPEGTEDLKPGELIQLSDGQERFWVQVVLKAPTREAKYQSGYYGKTVSNLVCGQPYAPRGSIVGFDRCHAYKHLSD